MPMLAIQGPHHSGFQTLRVLTFLSVLQAFLFAPLAWPQQHSMDSMSTMDMENMDAVDPAAAARQIADKQESEFNHHLAGIIIILAGLFILAEGKIGVRWPLVRYAWPMCFFAAGLFLLIFSDTEIWPFGPQSPWYAVTHNAEDLQHKTFAVILLSLGYVAFQRARGRWKTPWAALFFPVVGAAGAILLIFHTHGANMQVPNGMATMEHIQRQHNWFATVGLGIAIANGLAETPQKWQRFFRVTWPAMLIVLGILLTRYVE